MSQILHVASKVANWKIIISRQNGGFSKKKFLQIIVWVIWMLHTTEGIFSFLDVRGHRKGLNKMKTN